MNTETWGFGEDIRLERVYLRKAMFMIFNEFDDVDEGFKILNFLHNSKHYSWFQIYYCMDYVLEYHQQAFYRSEMRAVTRFMKESIEYYSDQAARTREMNAHSQL